MAACDLRLSACRAHSRGRLVWAVGASAVLLAVALTTRHIRRIEAALATSEREVSSKRLHVLHDVLDADVLAAVTEAARSAPFVRRSTPMRDGEAVSSHTLRGTPALRVVLDAIRDSAFVARVHADTGMRLQLVPRTDENSISVLRYSKRGDGIDAHRDGSVYIGSRWAGILVLADDGDASLVVDGVTLPTQPPNTLLLFEGDVSEHRVTRRTRDGERLVLNVLLCDVCAPKTDVWSKMWSSLVSHAAFY